MTTKLRHLHIDRIDFVDKGANPGARVCLFKRDTGEKDKMADDTQARIEELEAQLADVTKRAEEAETKLQDTNEVSKRVDDLTEQLAKSKQEVKDLQEANEMRQAFQKAEKIEAVFGPAADFASILRKIHNTLNEDERKVWDEKVDAAVTLVKESAHFKEIGVSGTDEGGDAYAKLEKAAKATFPDASTADAVAKFMVTDEGRELYQKYTDEQEGK